MAYRTYSATKKYRQQAYLTRTSWGKRQPTRLAGLASFFASLATAVLANDTSLYAINPSLHVSSAEELRRDESA